MKIRKRIPLYVRPFLWSYDVKKMDVKKDKKRILTNILNLGTTKATKWALSTYSKREIKDILRRPLPGEWNDKSLNFWSFLFNVTPIKTKRNFK
ncbi:MAG: hypothetical protein ABIH48_03365 [Candidatus Falkowbacteria bacterium]